MVIRDSVAQLPPRTRQRPKGWTQTGTWSSFLCLQNDPNKLNSLCGVRELETLPLFYTKTLNILVLFDQSGKWRIIRGFSISPFKKKTINTCRIARNSHADKKRCLNWELRSTIHHCLPVHTSLHSCRRRFRFYPALMRPIGRESE